jgi:hypothetical protein
MSIKTLRKRIALVAVSALGVGLLSVAPASAANEITADDVAVTAASSTTSCLAGTPTTSTTPRYMPVGGKQGFAVTTNGNGGVSVTGGVKITTVGPAGTINSSQTVATLDHADLALDADVVVEFTTTGPASVAFDDGTDVVETYYFIVVAAPCASGYSASTSLAQINDAAGDTATSNIDAAADLVVAYSATGTQKRYLDINLKNVYGNAVTTTVTPLIATSTGGCELDFDTNATSGSATAIATGAGNATNDLVILNYNDPTTCRVTITFGSFTVADKSVSFRGDAASIVVDKANSSSYWGAVDGSAGAALTNNVDALVYIVKDSAGNVIDHSAVPTLSSATGGFSQCTLGDGTYGRASATTNGFASVDAICNNATVFGAGEFKLKVVRQSDGVSVYSEVIKATMSKTTYTFEASWDKASYNIGDIMTLTVTAKDSGGRLVRDYTALTGLDISVAGATASITPAATDKVVNGIKKYKYIAGTTAAQYGYSVNLTSLSGQSAIVGNYTITNPSTGVTNAEVLSAIVKLIASINEQIALLQKQLAKATKKK